MRFSEVHKPGFCNMLEVERWSEVAAYHSLKSSLAWYFFGTCKPSEVRLLVELCLRNDSLYH